MRALKNALWNFDEVKRTALAVSIQALHNFFFFTLPIFGLKVLISLNFLVCATFTASVLVQQDLNGPVFFIVSLYHSLCISSS